MATSAIAKLRKPLQPEIIQPLPERSRTGDRRRQHGDINTCRH
jgi:hypothetical protein